jgi:hypothetical protein
MAANAVDSAGAHSSRTWCRTIWIKPVVTAQRAAKPRQTTSHPDRGPKMVLKLFRAMAALPPQKPTSVDTEPAKIRSADLAFEGCSGSCRDGAACRPPGWATTGCGTLAGCGCTRSCPTFSTAARTCGRLRKTIRRSTDNLVESHEWTDQAYGN